MKCLELSKLIAQCPEAEVMVFKPANLLEDTVDRTHTVDLFRKGDKVTLNCYIDDYFQKFVDDECIALHDFIAIH